MNHTSLQVKVMLNWPTGRLLCPLIPRTARISQKQRKEEREGEEARKECLQEEGGRLFRLNGRSSQEAAREGRQTRHPSRFLRFLLWVFLPRRSLRGTEQKGVEGGRQGRRSDASE